MPSKLLPLAVIATIATGSVASAQAGPTTPVQHKEINITDVQDPNTIVRQDAPQDGKSYTLVYQRNNKCDVAPADPADNPQDPPKDPEVDASLGNGTNLPVAEIPGGDNPNTANSNNNNTNPAANSTSTNTTTNSNPTTPATTKLADTGDNAMAVKLLAFASILTASIIFAYFARKKSGKITIMVIAIAFTAALFTPTRNTSAEEGKSYSTDPCYEYVGYVDENPQEPTIPTYPPENPGGPDEGGLPFEDD